MLNGQLTGKGAVDEGEWYYGDADSIGWASLPDSSPIPTLGDGSLLQFSNILNKEPSDPTWLPVPPRAGPFSPAFPCESRALWRVITARAAASCRPGTAFEQECGR